MNNWTRGHLQDKQHTTTRSFTRTLMIGILRGWTRSNYLLELDKSHVWLLCVNKHYRKYFWDRGIMRTEI